MATTRWRAPASSCSRSAGLLTNMKNKFDTTANETDEIPIVSKVYSPSGRTAARLAQQMLEDHLARIRITEDGFGRTHAR